jgi:UDP-N-acetylglucosamine--N-acetylmuramyl-(pentapeptide) pyrophosphoryl-undecaprenol N-acetylglucosamine transferase
VTRGRANDSLRVVFAGGGTGGHLTPGLATAEALRRLLPTSRPLFLVTTALAERHFAAALEEFEAIEVPPTPWHRPWAKLRFPLRALRPAERPADVVRAFRPHVIVALGGHTCVVPALIGRALGVRTTVLEQNAVPGRVTRLLAPLADGVFLPWDRARVGLHARRAMATGNPVRPALLRGRREDARRRLGLPPDACTLLAMGGSQGALALNEALLRALTSIRLRGPRLQVIHLTGTAHLERAARWKESGAFPSYTPVGFMERMADAYAAADFVLARAGGSTLAELTALGLPSILVPYPYAADGHQQVNASVLAEAGAAMVIEQPELNKWRLARAIRALAGDTRLRARMAERSRRLGRPDAALAVAAQLAAMAGFDAGQAGPSVEEAVPKWVPQAA